MYLIQVLGRADKRGVARMNAGVFDVLGYGEAYDTTHVGYCVDVELFGLLDELGEHHRVLLRHLTRALQVVFERLLVERHVHCGAAQHVRGAHEHWEADLVAEALHRLHVRHLLPARLLQPDRVEHPTELEAVLCAVDVLGARAEQTHVLSIERHCNVVWQLAAHREDNALGLLEIVNVHDRLEGNVLEVETVGHVVVGAHSLGVAVHHDSFHSVLYAYTCIAHNLNVPLTVYEYSYNNNKHNL